jgi:hypothetical protein
MPAYRAYRLDNRLRIMSGEWLEAPDDKSAEAEAAELCDEDSVKVEVWQAARKVGQVDCDD